MSTIKAAGGLCAPVGPYRAELLAGDDIWPNRITNLRGWRKWFSWDKDWGIRLRGGPHPKIRDMLPAFRAQRGGITYKVTA